MNEWTIAKVKTTTKKEIFQRWVESRLSGNKISQQDFLDEIICNALINYDKSKKK